MWDSANKVFFTIKVIPKWQIMSLLLIGKRWFR